VDSGNFHARCAHDGRGNWVCIWPVGASGAAGPCAFGPDGTVNVASRIRASDAVGTTQTAQLTRLRNTSEPLWTRLWQRQVTRPGFGVSIHALVVDRAGVLYWGGEDCDPNANRPSAVPSAGYYDSCVDARLVALDASGEPLWDWSFGTKGGLERISSLALAPEGVYAAGAFHGPLKLPQQPTIDGADGQDLYLMHFVDPRRVAWVHTWGSEGDDGNDLRIASSEQGEVAVTGQLGVEPTLPGFYARFAADGALRWQVADADTYIANLTLADDGATYSSNATRFDLGGARSELPGPRGLGIAKLHATDHSTLVFSAQDGNHVVETDLQGRTLRELQFEASPSFWYEGGLCVHAGQVAVSSTISQSSDFGLFAQPIAITQRSAFLLFLQQW
jgi:hypothetical protein